MQKIPFNLGGARVSPYKRYIAEKRCVDTPWGKPLRARIMVLDTASNTVVYQAENTVEHNYAYVAFSADESLMFVYESKLFRVTAFSTADWTAVNEWVFEELALAQRAYPGTIVTTATGFCITFCYKPEKGAKRVWHALAFDRTTGEKRVFHDVGDGETAEYFPEIGVVFECSPRLLDGEGSRFALWNGKDEFVEYGCIAKTPMVCADGLYYFEDYDEKRKDFSFRLFHQAWSGAKPQENCSFSLPFQPFPYMRKIVGERLLVGDVKNNALIDFSGSLRALQCYEFLAPQVDSAVFIHEKLYVYQEGETWVVELAELEKNGVSWEKSVAQREMDRQAELAWRQRRKRLIPKAKLIKKPIVILVPSADEKYVVGLTDRGRLYVIATATDEVVYETRTYPMTSACFSADSSLLYIYDSKKSEIRKISVEDWRELSVFRLELLKKADKDNWGSVYTTATGFCIDFCWKERVGETLSWNTFFYDEKTGQTHVAENSTHSDFEKLQGGRYALNARKCKNEYTVKLMHTPCCGETEMEICKTRLPFKPWGICHVGKNAFAVFGKKNDGEYSYAAIGFDGKVLLETDVWSIFHAVIVREKFYLADGEKVQSVQL